MTRLLRQLVVKEANKEEISPYSLIALWAEDKSRGRDRRAAPHCWWSVYIQGDVCNSAVRPESAACDIYLPN